MNPTAALPGIPAEVFEIFPVLHTPRLTLRALRPDDAAALHEIVSDAEAMRFWSTPAHTSREETDALLARFLAVGPARTGIEWALVLREAGDDRLVGRVAYHRLLPAHARAEVGYQLARPHWRRGLITEALRAILAFGFGPMRLHTVEAQLDPANTASARTAEKLGFVREGHLRENFWAYGRFNDTWVYSLLAPR